MNTQTKQLEIKSAANDTNTPILGGLFESAPSIHPSSNDSDLLRLLRKRTRQNATGKNNFRNLVEIGDYHLLNESYDNSYKAYIQALKISKINLSVYEKLIGSLIALNKLDLANSFFEELLSESGKRLRYISDYISFRIAFFYESPDTKEFVSNHLNTQDANVQNAIGLYFLIGELHPDAKNHFDKALAINPDSVDVNNNIGVYYKSQNEFSLALKYLNKAHYLDLQYVPAYENIASIHISLKNKNKAIDILTQAADNSVVLSDVWRENLAYLLSDTNNPELALENYLALEEANPDNFLLLNNIGALLKKQGKIKKATNYFKRAISAFKNFRLTGAIYDDRSALMFNNLAQIYIDKEEYDSALKYALLAEDFFPNHHVGFHQHGVIARVQGQYGEAKILFSRALSINPAFKPSVINLSYILEDDDLDYEGAVKIFDNYKAATDEPIEGILANNLAYAYLKVGRISDAEPLLDQSMNNDLDFAMYATKGFYHLQKDEIDLATADYTKAQEVAPNEKKDLVKQFYSYEFMRYWHSKGDLQKAIQYASSALDVPINKALARESRVFLRQLKNSTH